MAESAAPAIYEYAPRTELHLNCWKKLRWYDLPVETLKLKRRFEAERFRSVLSRECSKVLCDSLDNSALLSRPVVW
jgi:hypothetical protein